MREKMLLTYKEIQDTVQELDLFSRVLIGQYDEVVAKASNLFIFHPYEDIELDKLLRQLRNLLIPSLHFYSLGASLGIWSEETPLIAKRAFDIQQCLRYQLAYHRNPEGDITVDFRIPYIHGEWNVNKEQEEEYASILRKNQIGIYHTAEASRYPWSCPIVFEQFGANTVNILVDDEEIITIMDKAEKWYSLIQNNNLHEMFLEAMEYSDGNATIEEISPLATLVEDHVQKLSKEIPYDK